MTVSEHACYQFGKLYRHAVEIPDPGSAELEFWWTENTSPAMVEMARGLGWRHVWYWTKRGLAARGVETVDLPHPDECSDG